MSYSFPKVHSYLINSLQIREKMFTETRIQSSFLGIRLNHQIKDDKSALPRSSEANSAGLGWVALDGTSLGNSIRTRLSVHFWPDARSWEVCSHLLASCSKAQGAQIVGRGLFALEGEETTSTFTVWYAQYPATQASCSPVAKVSLSLPLAFPDNSEGWGTHRITSVS